jgi:hypothetical protein
MQGTIVLQFVQHVERHLDASQFVQSKFKN